MTRSAAIVALTALVAVAGIITVLATPAQAQNDERSSGHIIARRIDTYRIEVGWQTLSGARVFPSVSDDRFRYFSIAPRVDYWSEWHRSFPISTRGTEIGRIDARIVSGRRIEFAFTPTDGERILPPKRYFPMDTRVNRWLRSSEITIGPVAPRYTAVSAGFSHTCAIRVSGTIDCWGETFGHSPTESFTAISAGYERTCAIRENGAITCWGYREYGQITVADGRYAAVGAGHSHTCAILDTGVIECWGDNEHEQIDAPEGRHTAISVETDRTCAIRDTGESTCWGFDPASVSDFPVAPPDDSFTAISAGGGHTCAIRESGEIACWGMYHYGETDAPDGTFTAVSAGGYHACAIRESDGAIECWGMNRYGQTDAPDGTFTAVSAGGYHTCAIRENGGAIECWGDNEYGQATPPTD